MVCLDATSRRLRLTPLNNENETTAAQTYESYSYDCVISVQHANGSRRGKDVRADASTNITTALTLANNVHDFEGRSIIFKGLTEASERKLINLRERFVANECETSPSWARANFEEEENFSHCF